MKVNVKVELLVLAKKLVTSALISTFLETKLAMVAWSNLMYFWFVNVELTIVSKAIFSGEVVTESIDTTFQFMLVGFLSVIPLLLRISRINCLAQRGTLTAVALKVISGLS